MSSQLKIVLLGHGAVAGYVTEHVLKIDGIQITALICRDGSSDRARRFSADRFPIFTSVGELDTIPDVIVDCAGHTGLLSHAEDALKSGINVVSISTGALASDGVIDALDRSAQAGNSRIRFLSGAVAGIDALTAASIGELDEVIYTGKKPPKGWVGSPAEQLCDLENLSDAFEHFSGTARQAAKRYPKNANVAATIALASVGLDKVNVKLIADPDITRNVHEVQAVGAFGTLRIRLEGKPLPDNPGSSALAAMSLVAELQRYKQRVVL